MKRSKHSLSNYKLLTMNMGKLIPINWFEALPGDTIQQATAALVRVSPLLAPIMHPVRVRIHHWFVPNRLLFDGWEDFITGGPDGNDETAHPYVELSSVAESSIWDYLGIAPGSYSANPLQVNALPLRAYNLIFNEHYRDQDLVTELDISTDPGADTTTETDIQNVSWEKDYFTTSRPWEQKGTAVTIPIGEEADVVGDVSLSGNPPVRYLGSGAGTYNGIRDDWQGTSMSTNSRDITTLYKHASIQPRINSSDLTTSHDLIADLSTATGISVNDLRLAVALQRYQERSAIYGSRYSEYLRSLGVRSSDARLANPEYLGGGRQVIQFSEVLQTAEGTDPVGALKGHGISAMRTNRYRRFFEEHGIVMTLMSVVPKAIYSQALNRAWLRTTKEEYFQKELQFIGEQEITNREAYSLHSDPGGTWGYQARYDEYRKIPSSIGGEFRSTLNHWHYARIHSGDIALNQSFTDAVPTNRVYASTATDQLYVMANHSIQARRLLISRAYNKLF